MPQGDLRDEPRASADTHLQEDNEYIQLWHGVATDLMREGVDALTV